MRKIVSAEICQAFGRSKNEFPLDLKTTKGMRFIEHLTEGEVREIQESVLNGSYELSPARFFSFQKDDPIRERFPYSVNFPVSPNHSFALYIYPEDELVLKGLEKLIQKQNLPTVTRERSFAYREDKGLMEYVTTLIGWGSAEVLLKFDLTKTFGQIEHARLRKKLESVFQDFFILGLYHSFMSLPVLLKDETEVVQGDTGLPLPSASRLSPVLLNFYLETLDVALKGRFPQLPYARYGIERIIALPTEEDSKKLTTKCFNEVFVQLGLVGQITCILKGGSARFEGGTISLDRDGLIQITPREVSSSPGSISHLNFSDNQTNFTSCSNYFLS